MITDKIEDILDDIKEFFGGEKKINFIIWGVLGIISSTLLYVISIHGDWKFFLLFPIFGYIANGLILIAVCGVLYLFMFINYLIDSCLDIKYRVKSKKLTIKQLLIQVSIFVIAFTFIIYFIKQITEYVLIPVIVFLNFIIEFLDSWFSVRL